MRLLRSLTGSEAFMWTDAPYDAVWDHLRVLQQPAAMCAILVGKTGTRKDNNAFETKLAEGKSKQISYLLLQADEHFQAADAVTLTTKPLPLYYGMLSLAKALIVAWRPDRALLDLRYHGLDRRPHDKKIAAYQADPNAWLLGAEFAAANDGVFQELFRLIHDEELPKQAILRFDDLLRTDAEISSSYNRVNEFRSQTIPLYDLSIKEDPYQITICPSTTDKSEFLRVFDCLANDFIVSDQLRHEQALVVKNASHVIAWPKYLGVQSPSAGGRYLVGPVTIETGTSTMKRHIKREVADFASVFILSSLVRYKAEFWIDIVRGDPRGNVGIVNLHLNACRRRFPHFVLNGLYGEKFEFGSQARLG